MKGWKFVYEKWEYRTLKFKTGGFMGGKIDEEEFQEELNRHGDEGWELVSCFDTSQSSGSSRDIVVVFKRKKNM
ncbi:DUF4177 domain-containing protein [Paenibacillus guangzhouensis]|uniref:DUF4177 domain-containing protein n=1 Tax=Paenibacillus guangzhouensis TaxID=1473112 RepID=UPI00126739B1|nr:DUF4177 domain-containing protein [Paenibacillus guangzhouensis]